MNAPHNPVVRAPRVQQIMRVGKTEQDRMPTEQRPRVQAAKARRAAMQFRGVA